MYHLSVIRRLYINNFRCLENFELPISGRPSTLLIGKNGAGKTTVGLALEILQKISRGTSRVGELVKPKDFTRGRTDVPMRFEMEVDLGKQVYGFSIAFDYPKGFRELRIFQEQLTLDGQIVYSRESDKVHLRKGSTGREAEFFIDWHLVALPIIQSQLINDPVLIFRQWLGRTLILRPIPSLIQGHSQDETLQPDPKVIEIGAWFLGLISHAPSAYGRVYDFLKQVMPDLDEITNPLVGTDSRSLLLQFSNDHETIKIPFEDLSDGEKCFIISSLVLAANKAYGPLLCFWDEPDNYLAPSEIGHFIVALRQAFQPSGQFIATSHSAETIRRFSDENTLVLYRKSHLEPTIVRTLDTVPHTGDTISALVRDDLDL